MSLSVAGRIVRRSWIAAGRALALARPRRSPFKRRQTLGKL